MKVLSVKGIILGSLAVFIIDIISSIGLIPLFASDMSPESFAKLYTDTGALIYSMLFGTVSTIAGGFVAAKIGTATPYNNALAVGIMGIILGAFLSSGFPIWFNILAFSTTIPAALVGAYFVVRKRL